jgi:hypothetical protein
VLDMPLKNGDHAAGCNLQIQGDVVYNSAHQRDTINYFSPYVIVDGASQGIVNGSFISFALMFLSALFLGRLWCGWACPAGEPGATTSAGWRRA